MNKPKINALQLAVMMEMMLVSSFVGIGMFALVKSAGVDAYMSIIIAAVVGIIIILTFFAIFDYEPDLSISEKFIKVFGKKIGNILNFICIFIVFTIGISAMFNLTTFISSQFLKETPHFLIGFCFALVIILVNIKGLETLSRTCLILFAINITLFLISMGGLIPQFQISNIQPVLEEGFKRPMLGAMYNFLFNLVPIYLLLIVPKNQLVNKDKYRKYMWIFYTCAVIIKFLLILVTLGVLGIHLASIYQYPEYVVMKRINLFEFVDRIENVITIQWLFGLFFNISFVVYFISNSIKPANESKILPILITTFILFLSLILFKNNTQFNDYTYRIVPYIRTILLSIYILLFICIVFKKKNKK